MAPHLVKRAAKFCTLLIPPTEFITKTGPFLKELGNSTRDKETSSLVSRTVQLLRYPRWEVYQVWRLSIRASKMFQISQSLGYRKKCDWQPGLDLLKLPGEGEGLGSSPARHRWLLLGKTLVINKTKEILLKKLGAYQWKKWEKWWKELQRKRGLMWTNWFLRQLNGQGNQGSLWHKHLGINLHEKSLVKGFRELSRNEE